ncbi:unnamed protein product [Ostreobium quekettii]|uniref:Flavin-containing monooxygenase n=1 Tax=Ostreobium quekettii TaxID=121088 RepID=A0A8S1ISW3_9CHLO|nr:unnamed protein product [Ostreobium quekettii]|eukprot:evm.model.scf_174.5 EVM.evm.TU.scf_174.5   scf_174:62044-67036(-)
MIGARLARLGVPAIILERRARPGDSWRHRYASLATHDPVWMNHLPYIPFPSHWPTYFPKDKLADWLEMYVKVMELNYWGGSACTGAAYDEGEGVWRVTVDKGGAEVTLRPRQLVLATGVHGAPFVPDFPGAASFKGPQVHSGNYKGDEEWEGLRCVVIGSNNSAHDICHDLWERGALPTMIQRTSTHVTRSAVWQDMYLKPLYSEEALASGMTTDKADMIFASIPYRVHAVLDVPTYTAMAKRDAPFYKRLTDVGFLLDFGEDGSGLFMKWLRRGAGFYIDTGASDLISSGDIGLKSSVGVDSIGEASVKLTDGTVLPADVIVYATGWASLSDSLGKMTSPEVAGKVGRCWGLGSNTTGDPGPWEGELRNMYKPTAQRGLWIFGGSFMQCRFYSQFLALQVKARMEGLHTPVYGGPEVATAN